MRRMHKGKSQIESWKKMEKEIKKKFLPSNYLQNSFLKFYHLRQENCPIEEYTKEFDYLILQSDISQLAVRYI